MAICNQRFDRDRDEWQSSDTIAACRAAGAAGIRTGSGWSWSDWAYGWVEGDNLVYRFDEGVIVSFGDGFYEALDSLSPGSHTVAVREQHPWGWTDWSTPYSFTVVAQLEIVAVCNNGTGASFTFRECKAAEQAGLSLYVGWRHFANGIVEWGNVVYSFDGGPGALGTDSLGGLSPTPGSHYYQIREQRPWGWTSWSEPYWFTVVP